MTIPIRFVTQTLVRGPCKDPQCDRKNCFSTDVIYALPDGTRVEPQVGDVYFGEDHRSKYECAWSNCDGRHLFCLLPPDAHPWNIDGRASNCTMPEEKTHRCWVRHGDPASGTLHVDKVGHTCNAGAGSIAVTGYHGFLHNGVLTSC